MSTPVDMHPSIDPELIDRYLTGTATPAEVAIAEAWLGTADAVRAAGDGGGGASTDRWTLLEARMRTLDADGENASVSTGTHHSKAARSRIGMAQFVRGTRHWLVRGVLVPVSTAIVALWVLTGHSGSDSSHQYRTQANQRAELIFADGDRLFLAPRSQVTIHPHRRFTSRLVDVWGDVYFNVVHHTGAAFVVRAGPAAIRVLGTAFDVQYDIEQGTTQVAVSEGKVATARGSASPVTLSQGMIARVTDSSIVTSQGDVPGYVEWAQRPLRFHDTPVADMLAQVGRWYGYDIRLTDSLLKRQRVNAALDYDSGITMLRALQHLLDVEITVDDSGHGLGNVPVVTLMPRRVKHAVPMMSTPQHSPWSLSGEVGR